MNTFKHLFWSSVAAVAFTSCASSRVSVHNPVIKNAIAMPQDEKMKRGNNIGLQDAEKSQGFHVINKNFVIANTYFSDANKKRKKGFNDDAQTTLGFDLLHNDVYSIVKDKRQRIAVGEKPTCDAQTAIFLGHLKDMPSSVQLMALKAQAAADSSDKTNHMPDPEFREMEPNVVEVFQRLGGGYSRIVRENFNTNIETHGACGLQSSVNPIDFTDATVVMARNFAAQNDSPTRRFHPLANTKK